MANHPDNESIAQEQPQLVDQPVRHAIAHDLDSTLFVEASAGTGKTASLVARIVNLVASGRATLDRIAAITFTEAAAAELRDRVRQSLEDSVADANRGEEEIARCQRGITDLDQATISTLHSFAAQLLHERPLEAGLPPGFETSDQIVAGLKFEEAWDEWLDQILEEDSDLASPLSLLLNLRFSLADLKTLARVFQENYADLPGVEFGAVQPPEASSSSSISEQWTEIERLCQYSRNGAGDSLFDHVQNLASAFSQIAEVEPGSFPYLRLLSRLPNIRTNSGRQSDWDADPLTGQNACAALKAQLRDLSAGVSDELAQAKSSALLEILGGLRRFVLEYASQRKTEGRAEFQDLLVWARNLLRDDLAVRDHFRHRFSQLLVDESQDTDPIQAEIAMFLAEALPADGDHQDRPRSWEQVLPEPGKLFVVGDPKQSIYRFRRADVEQMRSLKQRMEEAGGRTVELVQNFRSQPPLVEWVNHLFESWMSEDPEQEGDASIQVDYSPMAPHWQATAVSPESLPVTPRVWALGDEETEGSTDQVRRQEAREIAALVKQVVDQQWLKLDETASKTPGKEKYLPVAYSDICVLMPARTALPSLERALESANIPYRLESASLVFETQEVRDLLNCLRAIDNPADRVAIVAALRSPAFGCSDIDLLNHYEGGSSFDYLAQPGKGSESLVSQCLATLQEFHEDRVWESPGALVERFIRERQLLEAATGHPRMREQWRRYRFLVEQAWQFAAAGGSSLREFVNWVSQQIAEGARVTETPVPESDDEAIRIMTIHAAKGLEFPVVILTGINSQRRSSVPAALFDRQRNSVEVGFGPRDRRFETPGHASLAERERALMAAEDVRLIYVATTRARDHLVLSLRRPAGGRGRNTPAATISDHLSSRPDLWSDVVLPGLPVPADPGEEESASGDAVTAPVAHTVAARDTWRETRQELLDNMARPSFVAATALNQMARDEEGERDNEEIGEPWRRGRAGTSVGRAVHAVLQSIDLATGEGIPARARNQAMAEGVPDREDEIANLAMVAVNSAIVRRAVASGRLWREVPVATPIGNGFLHGFIDLMFEEPDGLVIVDYKTDTVEDVEDQELIARQAIERYRLQGGAYAQAVSQATGKNVKEMAFLYLQPSQEIILPDLAAAMADARDLATKVLGPTGA